MVIALTAAIAGLASAPFWLPTQVTKLREWIFERINGPEGIMVPGPDFDATTFRELYAHPAANGRSKGAGLSDLFWYWLSPGAEVHQEHLEAGEGYDAVARTTRYLLAVPNAEAERRARQSVEVQCRRLRISRRGLVRLRDVMMPVWARFYWCIVFGEECPAEAELLIVGNANDVVTALKCCSLRHMDRRAALTSYVRERLTRGGAVCALPETMGLDAQALYLQGVFFNTAIVQMSEAMTHLVLAVAQHAEVQRELLNRLDQEMLDSDRFDEDRYLDRVIAEALRRYPLFGIAHRITTDEIALRSGERRVHKGSVLCFHYAAYQNSGFMDPEEFRPERWETISAKDATYIPFGVTANRPCPAHAIALVTMRAAARAFLREFAVESTAAHARSIPNRGPCLLIDRKEGRPGMLRRRWLLGWLAIRDRMEDVLRSVKQLILGTIMVVHARRLRLAERHFSKGVCPVTGHAREAQ